jgi:sortase A
MSNQKMPKRKRFWIFLAIRTIANILIISGIILSFFTFYPYIKQEIWYWWHSHHSEKIVATVETKQTPKKTLPPLGVAPVDTNFGIVIEKIDVNAPIVANVDPANYHEYIAALAKGVAQAKGTAVPGSTKSDNNNVFLFAHSAINVFEAKKYNSVFYLLRKLEVGDRVTTFYQNKRYDYIVTSNQVVEATDTKYLSQASKDPILTLQTCDPPGSSLHRLIVTAKLDEI